MEKKIYVVESECGWADISIIDCAFCTKESADAYIKNKEALRDSISDDLYLTIQKAIEDKEVEIEQKYYVDYDMEKLRPGMTEEGYDNEMNQWYEEGKQKFVEDAFKVSWEAFNEKLDYVNGNTAGYSVTETILYGE